MSDQDFSLPAWTYYDSEYFSVEMARLMRPSWQVVCHLSDIANAGDWHTFEFLGESILVVRNDDGAVRAFTNVCRHRASRLVSDASGCAKRFTCPYHGWTYGLDGRLIGVPNRGDYPELDVESHGLAAVELEVWRGFVFIRLAAGGTSVAATMAPYEDQIAPYRFEELRALGRVTLRPRAVNWKNVADNYSDGLHITVAHPGLTRLFGRSYGVEANERVDRMWGMLAEQPSPKFSECMYQRTLPPIDYLPEQAQRQWLYFKLWPNVAFDVYPDQIDFMQFLPVSPTGTLIREINYAIPDDRRAMKVARYLNWRINRRVNAEDTALITSVQQGMQSASFTVGPLGRSEVCLRSFCRRVRELIPEARMHQPPAAGWSAKYSCADVRRAGTP